VFWIIRSGTSSFRVHELESQASVIGRAAADLLDRSNILPLGKIKASPPSLKPVRNISNLEDARFGVAIVGFIYYTREYSKGLVP